MSHGKFDYLVNVSEAAFQSMVIATIESFLVPGRCGRSGRLMRHEGPGLARTLVPLAWPPEVPARLTDSL